MPTRRILIGKQLEGPFEPQTIHDRVDLPNIVATDSAQRATASILRDIDLRDTTILSGRRGP